MTIQEQDPEIEYNSVHTDIEENDFLVSTFAAHAADTVKAKVVVVAPTTDNLLLQAWELKKFNPRTPEQALAAAKRESERPSRNYQGLCAKSCSVFYGFGGSGETDARSLWSRQEKNTTSDAPAGALVFWNVGNHGHVALAAGNGKCWSVDIVRSGKVNLVDIDTVSNVWNAHYQGWSLPYFPRAWGPIGPRVILAPPPQYRTVSTQRAIEASKTSNHYYGITTIAYALKAAGYTGFMLNDVWGDGKKAAWKKWQNALGVKRPDGIIGAFSLKKLSELGGFPLVR